MQHAAERDELWLLTPAGQALAHIVGDAEGATFTRSGRRQYQAADIGSPIRGALGRWSATSTGGSPCSRRTAGASPTLTSLRRSAITRCGGWYWRTVRARSGS